MNTKVSKATVLILASALLGTFAQQLIADPFVLEVFDPGKKLGRLVQLDAVKVQKISSSLTPANAAVFLASKDLACVPPVKHESGEWFVCANGKRIRIPGAASASSQQLDKIFVAAAKVDAAEWDEIVAAHKERQKPNNDKIEKGGDYIIRHEPTSNDAKVERRQ